MRGLSAGVHKNSADFEKKCVFFLKTRKKTLSIFAEMEYNDYRAISAEMPQKQGIWRGREIMSIPVKEFGDAGSPQK